MNTLPSFKALVVPMPLPMPTKVPSPARLRIAHWMVLFTALLCFQSVAQAQDRTAGPAQRAATPASEAAAQDGRHYAVIAFHDVADRVQDLDADAITSDRLVAFFDWLQGNGWHPISLNDIAAAQSGKRPLPPKPVLITFDDGYASLYTRVYPLALAYRFPVVAALVGDWMRVPPDALVQYGDEKVPRSRFITWEQARQMQASGLVEFASHSFALHEGITANPQGNTLPSAVALRYRGPGDIESPEAQFNRIRADLEQSRALMQRELGVAPRALVWPFGRYNAQGRRAAQAAGFEFAFSLQPAIADLADPLAIARYWPSHNPTLADLASNLNFAESAPPVQRLVCLQPARLWDADPAVFDARLGQTIERLRVLGATTVLVEALAPADATGEGASPAQSWFPNGQVTMRANALSRIAWQIRTRAGVEVVARLPYDRVRSLVNNPADALQVYASLGAQLPWDGFLLEDASASADEATLRAAFAQVAAGNPELRMLWRAPANASVNAPDALATSASLMLYNAAQLKGPIETRWSRRVALWLEQNGTLNAADLSAQMTDFQVRGGTALGWCPDDPIADQPRAAQAAPAVSASTYPVRF